MNTVNVIEIPDLTFMNINQLVAFEDTTEGNKQAEALFRSLVSANYDISKSAMDARIEYGYFTRDNYYVAIVHSTPSPLCECGGRFDNVMVPDQVGNGLHEEIQCVKCGKQKAD